MDPGLKILYALYESVFIIALEVGRNQPHCTEAQPKARVRFDFFLKDRVSLCTSG